MFNGSKVSIWKDEKFWRLIIVMAGELYECAYMPGNDTLENWFYIMCLKN